MSSKIEYNELKIYIAIIKCKLGKYILDYDLTRDINSTVVPRLDGLPRVFVMCYLDSGWCYCSRHF